MEETAKTSISYVVGVEGPCIVIGDIRVTGPKPWGGGRVRNKWQVSVKSIIYALNNIYCPSHQPLGSAEAEAKVLLQNIQKGNGGIK
jgi:hypothetical protein